MVRLSKAWQPNGYLAAMTDADVREHSDADLGIAELLRPVRSVGSIVEMLVNSDDEEKLLKIETIGMEGLKTMLKRNTQLTQLSLGNCGSGSIDSAHGRHFIGGTIKSHPKQQLQLQLLDAPIALRMVVDGVRQSNLTSLDLSSNLILPIGNHFLGTMLSDKNCSLKKLTLDGNCLCGRWRGESHSLAMMVIVANILVIAMIDMFAVMTNMLLGGATRDTFRQRCSADSRTASQPIPRCERSQSTSAGYAGYLASTTRWRR